MSVAQRNNRYGTVLDYFKGINEQICMLVQIESRAGVAAARDIAVQYGVDCIFVGSSDMAAALGHLSNAAPPDVQAAIAAVFADAKAAGKPLTSSRQWRPMRAAIWTWARPLSPLAVIWVCSAPTPRRCVIAIMSAMHRTAQCACGATAITVSGEPEIYGVCHCTNCKRRTGSAFGISSYFSRDQVVTQSGETRVYAFHHQTQNHDQSRHFCPSCGTTLYWFLSTRPKLISIAAGCFGETPPTGLQYSVSHAKKAKWLGLPPDWDVQMD